MSDQHQIKELSLRMWRDNPGMARQLTAAPVAQPKVARRSFAAAQQNRLTASWTTTPVNINQLLNKDRRVLVARSRELCINDEYAKQFITLLKSNVVGAHGITVTVQALRENGSIDENDSAALYKAFSTFSKIGNFDVTEMLSRCDAERLYIETLARDGEVLVRRLKNVGPHGYQIQFLDSLLLDDTYNLDLSDGKKIRMGVEMDSNGKRLAYHLLPERVNDIQAFGLVYGGGQRVRVPASEIWHDFIVENVGQVRGIPWMAGAAMTSNMLGGYEESALVAARVGAGKMGFYKQTEAAEGTLADAAASQSDIVDASGNYYSEVEPGAIGFLPAGYEFQSFDPDYPHAMFPEFVKQCLRRVAAGLPGATYTSLSGDMSAVNYSSARVDMIRERETWKAIQKFICERFTARIYSEWLPWALLGGHVVSTTGARLPFSRLAKFDAAEFQGTRWPWVDPNKEVNAYVTAIDNGLTSRSRVIREQGGDPEVIWRELEKENKRLKGVLPNAANKPQTTPANAGVVVSAAAQGEDDE